MLLNIMSLVFELDPELATDRAASNVLNIAATLVVLASTGVFFVVLKISRRFAISSAEDVLSWDVRKPVLYLRTFEDDKQYLRRDPTAEIAKWANPVLVAFQGIIGNVRFEEKLLAVCEQVGPFIGLGHPTDRNEDYSGAARLSPFGDEWKDVVLDLMDKSAVIIIRATSKEGEGMLWELDQIAFHKLAPKTVLYIEFDGTDDDDLRRARYQKYADMIRGRYDVELPPFDPLKRFIFTPVDGKPWSGHSHSLSEVLANNGHPAERGDMLPLAKSAAPGASWLRSPKVEKIADAQPSSTKAVLLFLISIAFGAALGLLNVSLETALIDFSLDWTLNKVLDGDDVSVDAVFFFTLAVTSVFFPAAVIIIGVLVGWLGGWLRLPGARIYIVSSIAALVAFYQTAYGGFIWPYFTTGPDPQVLDELGMPEFLFWFGTVMLLFADLFVLLLVTILARIYSLSPAERDISASWQQGDVFLDEPLSFPNT